LTGGPVRLNAPLFQPDRTATHRADKRLAVGHKEKRRPGSGHFGNLFAALVLKRRITHRHHLVQNKDVRLDVDGY